MSHQDADSLNQALERASVVLPGEQVLLLERYCHALWQWNAKLNLTRHTSYEKFVSRDVIDSLELARHLNSHDRVLDVGTGGGVPGVILAIVRPDLRIELCDSVGKKARAVTSILADLGLQLPVHASAAQEVLRTSRFDTLVIRAVAPLAKVLTWFAPHWRSIGRLLIIKGPAWVEERHVAREKGLLGQLSLRKVAAYPLPGTQSESVILSIAPKPNQGAAP